MKIAFIIYPDVIISNKSNGIRSQAITWGENLRRLGHHIDYINNWGDYDWKTYDVIHFFGAGGWAMSVAHRLKKINDNLVLSPIIDPVSHPNYLKYNTKYLISNFLKNKINFNDNNFDTSLLLNQFKKICVRSEYEGEYISRVFHVSDRLLSIIPLSYDMNLASVEWNLKEKENFCLHISSIYQPRKNVIRLIEAAKKYDFKLILAGNKGTEDQFKPLKDIIGESNNIEVLGFISEKEKIDLYKRASVFALPSIQEGVGIVALDAAILGCEIVISNIKGPKEYYNNKCFEVDPFDVDSIGIAIINALSGIKGYQPNLSDEVREKYSSVAIACKIENMYSKL